MIKQHYSPEFYQHLDDLASTLCARFAGQTTVPKLVGLCELPVENLRFDDTLELPAITA